jgi:8-amino-3,8-dideoxy-alpha-D-manno-octulosonate transaminase
MPGTELFGAEERKEVNDVLETGILFRYNHDEQRKGLWKAKAFEAEVCQITGATHAHAVANGTAGITAALAAAGIGLGDEVVVPPFTYIATIEAVLFLGAVPVFAEIDDTLCLSAAGILKVLTPKTKAVCLVHMCGGMADMDAIMPIIEQHNLILVEDAGQSFGSSYKGTYTGLFGTAGSYSFDFFKIATAGEGGVVVTNSESVYRIIDAYTDHGHDHMGNNRGMEQHPILGFNFRISELHAAVALAQTRKVPQILSQNKKNKALLTALLATNDSISFSRLPDEEGDSATFMNMMLPDTKTAGAVVAEMQKAGIGGFNYWYTNMYHFINQWDHIKGMKSASRLGVHQAAHQDYSNLDLPVTQHTIGRCISFGIRCTWTEDDINKLALNILACVNKGLAAVEA